ncbi:ribonuclease H1 isoform X2 [Brienomyrus brachyistius]|uniref:ribonuclease H1 isoform X2 n=1 Tax=Brienomyrus brachyistius TaxID=42636 RepID=UPI0020B37D54|nr:ribonuclease H1 isoform X2 [Brienomyrus brachyistius]
MLNSLYSITRRAFCTGTVEMVKKKYYYAVRRGAKPGVYCTWDECESQVKKFPSAVYKKFASEEDAWAFVREQSADPSCSSLAVSDCPGGEASTEIFKAVLPTRSAEGKRPHVNFDDELSPKRQKCAKDTYDCSAAGSRDGLTFMGDAVVVYTDGCCSCNGKHGARAGIGVYWGPDHRLNVSDRLHGRQTNQRAELLAACRALEQAKDLKIKKLVLYTDSMFTINGVTCWVKNWKRNGWRLKNGGLVTHRDEFEKLDKLNAEIEVVWLHIPGHAGYKGNEEADRLSREGASKPL